MIETKRQEVFDDLQQIEERMKRNFEPRKPKDKDEHSQEEDHETEAVKEEDQTGSPKRDAPPALRTEGDAEAQNGKDEAPEDDRTVKLEKVEKMDVDEARADEGASAQTEGCKRAEEND